MKMKFLTSVLAAAFAGIASATTIPSIYEIRAWDNETQTAGAEPYVTSQAEALVGGETFYFAVRLLNPDFAVNRINSTTYWKWKWYDATGIYSESTAVAARPAGIGIVVNGRTESAQIVDIRPGSAGYTYYTDIICKYTVKEGDIALPVRLAKNGAGEPVDGGDAIYFVNGYDSSTSQGWKIVSTADESVEAQLMFASDTTGAQDQWFPSRTSNYDMYLSQFLVKTVDFANQSTTYGGNTYWALVHENSTTSDSTLTIEVTGSPSVSSKLYIWSDNDAAIKIISGNDVMVAAGDDAVEMANPVNLASTITASVGTIKLTSGQSSYTFKVQAAGTEGQVATIYLSEYKGFQTRDSGSLLIEDYLTEQMVVGEKLTPRITLTGADPMTVGTDYESSIGTLTLTMSEAYTEDVTVTVTPEFQNTTATTGLNIYDYVHIAKDNEAGSYLNVDTVQFTFPAGTTSLTKNIYVFGLGADKYTSTTGNGVRFKVTVDSPAAAATYYTPSHHVAKLVPSAPVLTTASSVKGVGNVERTFSFTIADNYKNVTDTATGYTIEYKLTEEANDWETLVAGDADVWVLNSSGVLASKADPTKLPSLLYASGEYITTFRVKTPVGDVVSNEAQVSVSISEPATMQAYVSTDGGASYVTSATFDESDEATIPVKVTLTKSYNKTVYAFLKPKNDETKKASAGYPVTTSAATQGLRIESGEYESEPGYIEFPDGGMGVGTLCQYEVVLCTSEDYDENNIVTGYQSKTLKLYSKNVEPAITGVTINGGNAVEVSGGTFEVSVAKGIEQTFQVMVDDVTKDIDATDDADTTDKDERFALKWEFSGAVTDNDEIYGNPNDAANEIKYTFNAPGTVTLTFQAKDKDMKAYGQKFVCKLVVNDSPSVSITTESGFTDYAETSVGQNASRMSIVLSEAYAQEQKVKIVVDSLAPAGTADAKKGVLILGGIDAYDSLGAITTDPASIAYYVATIPAGVKTANFYLDTLDGTKLSSTKGWKISPSVITEGNATIAHAPTIPWSDFYTSTPTVITVQNVEPVLITSLGEENTESNAFAAAIGAGEPIEFSIDDIAADLDAGVTVTWKSDDGSADTQTCTDTDSKTFTPAFTSPGTKRVRVTVADKDKDSGIGSFERTWYFKVADAKEVKTRATGPSGGNSNNELSRLYASQEGIGKGHVYVSGKGVLPASAESFNITWNCGTLNSVSLYAFGYQSGAKDDGNLDRKRDWAIDKSGSRESSTTVISDPYEYKSMYDSFFYGWISASEPGGSDYSIRVAPVIGTNTAEVADFILPTAKTDDGNGYVPTFIEAIFSAEYDQFDNMGDIDHDGIPDIFAIKTYANNATLAKTDGAGGELGAVNARNDDNDFLPSTSQLGRSTIVPGSSNSWATAGQAFTAFREIRGLGDGLNYGMFRAYHTGAMARSESEAGWISTLSLTDNEKRSLMRLVLETRDNILNRRYTGRAGTYDGTDWIAVTNILASVIRSGSTAMNPVIQTCYVYDQDAHWECDVEDENYPGITVNRWIVHYDDGTPEGAFVTNILRGASSLYSKSNTVTHAITELGDMNPADTITLDDINFGEWLDGNLLVAGLTGRQQQAAKHFIDLTWRHYAEAGTWGWTCENRTDPMIDDTDGDGMPDGYEYFIWYDAVVGTEGKNRLTGYKFNLDDIESREDIITPETIAGIYNPNINRTWTHQDTDNDGIYDLEEFLIGTSPVHWDSDGDGLSDLYEVIYNVNPLSGGQYQNGAMNLDGDFMAFVHDSHKADGSFADPENLKLPDFAPYTYVYEASDGTYWMLSNSEEATFVEAAWIDPTTNTVKVAGDGFQVFKFKDGWILPTEDTADFINRSGNVAAREFDAVVASGIATNTVSLYHHQVHNYFGFDPRTGWYVGENGTLSSTGRWIGQGIYRAGLPQNTAQFTALDEYLLLKYRYITGVRDIKDDKQKLKDNKITIYGIVQGGTTNPNAAFADLKWGSDTTVFAQRQHGADTDGDGVPDGWELYIGVNPNIDFTIRGDGRDVRYWDGNGIWPAIGENADYEDGLTLVGEYAGNDTCGDYEACPSIYANFPGNKGSMIRGWFNKFFPTDPRNPDTDGDLIKDGLEGAAWNGVYTFNRWGSTQLRTASVKHYSIYGNPTNYSSRCIRGGGYNPCTIDTDLDGLPDPWERQFAGLLFRGAEIPMDGDFENEEYDGTYRVFEVSVPNETFYDDIRAEITAVMGSNLDDWEGVYHVMMGMDGTVADAHSGTYIGAEDVDWDGDGLQNWQEYMVQAMRQFRYDDDKTPLIGSDSPLVSLIGGSGSGSGTITLPRYTVTPGAWCAEGEDGNNRFLKMSYTWPYTKAQLEYVRDELGYKNFADWALECIDNGVDYLGQLGYFADPPKTWDHARIDYDNKYMLPREAVQVYTRYTYSYTSHEWATDEDGNAIFSYPGGGLFTNNVSGTVKETSSGGYSAMIDGKSKKLTRVSTDVDHVEKRLSSLNHETSKVGGVPLYYGTDPRLWDTDDDGMDDYYELFHGLNPILGEVSMSSGTVSSKDVIGRACRLVTPWNNAWTGWDDSAEPGYDPIKFPWMMGVAACDADGDGIRNYEECLLANVTSPGATHTDPTPLWMTDSTVDTISEYIYTSEEEVDEDGEPVWDSNDDGATWFTVTNKVVNYDEDRVEFVTKPSYTALYYGNDISANSKSHYVNGERIATSFPVNMYASDGGWGSGAYDYIASFEENEGYDTDNDWRSDSIEQSGGVEGVEGTSDPQNFADPSRRQSIWFGGPEKPGLAMTVTPNKRHAHGIDLFKQFTVEAWVRPENASAAGDKYVVTRAVNYQGWDLINSNNVVRLNFAIGIDAEGRAFGEMQDSTEVFCRVEGTELVDNKWAHIAATFDGTTLTIYVNGVKCSSTETTLIPANGVEDIKLDPQHLMGEAAEYKAMYAATVIGGRPTDKDIFYAGSNPGQEEIAELATDFLKGSVAEVRIWDGARTASQVESTYKTRFTPEFAAAQRLEVFEAYYNGARRNDQTASRILPAELLHHYDFTTLPGATDAAYVQKVPAGFAANVLAVVRRPDTGETVDDLVEIGWWAKLADSPLASEVYNSRHVVPWIEDTMAHLPRLDGTVKDSVYWSENYAGYTPATDHYGIDQYAFNNTMDPYGNVTYAGQSGTWSYEDEYLWNKFARINNQTNAAINATTAGLTSTLTNDTVFTRFMYRYLRSFRENSDLVPVGSAFAKRQADYWDGQGPEDAWAITTKDGALDGDAGDTGTPDWARPDYSDPEKYAFWLSMGLMPDGTTNPAYVSTVDANLNGIPDWWERYYGVEDCAPTDDPDHDGLTNYQEWLISYGPSPYGYYLRSVVDYAFDPLKARSKGDAVVDYFLAPPVSSAVDAEHVRESEYLGEMVGDHDSMESWWEVLYGLSYANPNVYDPHLDTDGDSWDNFAEARSYAWHGGMNASAVDGYYAGTGSNHYEAHPMPAIGVRATYYGVQDINGASLVVRTSTANKKRVDATFVVKGSNSDDDMQATHMLGTFVNGATAHGILHPGHIIPGSDIKFQSRRIDAEPRYIWDCALSNHVGDESFVERLVSGGFRFIGTYSQYLAHVAAHGIEAEKVVSVSQTYDIFAQTSSDADGHYGLIHLSSSNLTATVVGQIDFTTGEYELDFGAITDAGVDLDHHVIRATYYYHVADRWPKTLWLSDASVAGGSGFLRQGKNTIEAFIDLNENGAYDIGEPYGYVRDVEVGWHKTGKPVVIELTDDSPVFKRIATASGDEGAGNEENTDAATVEEGLTTDVVVRRTEINGQKSTLRIVMKKTVVNDDRAYITEADAIPGAAYDLDLAWLVKDAVKMGLATNEIISATYEIVVNDEVKDTFTREFYQTRAIAKQISPLDTAPVYSAHPTFVFNTEDQTMTAYKLQISTSKNESDTVWESPVEMLPGRTPASLGDPSAFAVQPDVYVGFANPTNGATILKNGANYYWRVALLNAKWASIDDSAWSDWCEFTIDVENALTHPKTTTGYGKAAAVVRYFGPGEVGIADPTNIIVEAFATADFTGLPLARVRMDSTVEDLKVRSSIETNNVAIAGIEAGKVFLRAFIDSNNNGTLEPWESWGYGNNIGRATDFLYTPRAVEVPDSLSVTNSIAIFIEDTDYNQNEIPDILELDCFATQSGSAAAADKDTDLDGLKDAEETELGTIADNWDSDGDGMPDGWEIKFAQTDPLTRDADYVGERDVMAYVVTNLSVAVTAEGKQYVIKPGETGKYYTTFMYNGALAMGAPAEGIVAASVKEVPVTVIHGGVYDIFGFDPTTANPNAIVVSEGNTVYGVNTKEFTALDKYLVVKYLQEFGLANEVEMNTNGTWSASTYRPGFYDSNANGLPDGWELYMGFASANTSKAFPVDTTTIQQGFADTVEAAYDPYDDYYLYKKAVAEGLFVGDLALVPEYKNAEAVAGGYADGTEETLRAYWLAVPENDVMAYWKGVLHTVDIGGVTYVANPSNKVLYTTTEVNGQLIVTGSSTKDYTVDAYDTGVAADVVLIHSAVYDFFGFDPTTAKPGVATVTEGEDGAETTIVQGANTVPFTMIWKKITLASYESAGTDYAALGADVTDSNGNQVADGYELYIRYVNAASKADATIDYVDAVAQDSVKSGYDPYDDYYLYKKAVAEGAYGTETLEAVPEYDNAFAMAMGIAGATVEELDEFWNGVTEEDWCAYVKTNVQIMVVTDQTTGAKTSYAVRPGTQDLYTTFMVGDELFVGVPTTVTLSQGEFQSYITAEATIIHSAVYDWYGWDVTTARPKFFVPDSIEAAVEDTGSEDDSEVAASAAGNNTVAFTRRLKYITDKMYLPLVGAETEYDLTSWYTDTNGNDLPDGWELYVKYSVNSDPAATDDDYKEDFYNGADPNDDDTDDDGINDDDEIDLGTDPADPTDASRYVAGDVMAYAEQSGYVYTVVNDETGETGYVAELTGEGLETGDTLDVERKYLTVYRYGTDTDFVWGAGTDDMTAFGDLSKWRVTGVENNATIAFVHAQVYDLYGFNPNTANPVADPSVNTKEFTNLDKALVKKYFAAIGLTDASSAILKAGTNDTNLDGIPDGWELYTMFGPAGVSAARGTATTDWQISPWITAADARDKSRTVGGELTLVDEYDRGSNPTDPWQVDTDDDGISDAIALRYMIKGSDGLDDYDNDGLSNYAEYLLSEVFDVDGKKFDARNAYSANTYCLDYFYKIGKLYVGEIFTDHDQVEDSWEDQYASDYATRLKYDAGTDADDDGWSMRSEARYSQMVQPIIGSRKSHVNTVEDTVIDHPVPTLALTVSYNEADIHDVEDSKLLVYVTRNGSNAEFDAKFIVDGGTNSTSTAATSNAYAKVLGKWENRHAVGTLTPGNVKAKSIVIEDAYTPDNTLFSWRLSYVDSDGETQYVYRTGTKAEYLEDYYNYGKDTVDIVKPDSEYHPLSTMSIRTDGDIATVYMNDALTIEFGTINLVTGEYDFDFGALAGKSIWSVSDTNAKTPAEAHTYRVVYDVNPSADLPRTVYLGEATKGAIKEGKSQVIAILDTDGDGLYTPGEPMGVACDVDIGWKGGAAAIQLTRTSPVSVRADLVTGDNDREATWGKWSENLDEDTYEEAGSFGRFVRVRVVRSYYNGRAYTANDTTKVVDDRVVNISGELGKFIHEGWFMGNGKFDIDWDLAADTEGIVDENSDDIDIRDVVYRIVFGNGDIEKVTTASLSNTVSVARYSFIRAFDPAGMRSVAVAVEPTEQAGYRVTDARPTFRWTMTKRAGTYTAFRIVVTGEGFSYNSGFQQMPLENAEGEYVWTAPICVGDKIDGEHGYGVYANNKEYTWTVYGYNSKYKTDENGGSGKFLLNVAENNIAMRTQGVKVRYFGPVAADAATIRVQAFTKPDFTGEPVAAGYVTGLATLGDAGEVPDNATIVGIEPGTYYFRAFIDSNDNGVCDDWESMGYLCARGLIGAVPFNPTGVKYSAGVLGEGDSIEIYIEDADTNGNSLPDAYEYAQASDAQKADGSWRTNTPLDAITTDSEGIGFIYSTDLATLAAGGAGTATSGMAPVLLAAAPAAGSGASTVAMASQVVSTLSNPKIAALTFGYDTIEEAKAAAETIADSSVIAITSLDIDTVAKSVKIGYTSEVETLTAGSSASAFYVVEGGTVSFDVKVLYKANLGDADWTVAEVKDTVEVGTSSGVIEYPLPAAATNAQFFKIEITH